MPYTLTTSASTAVLQLNRSGGTLQPGAAHTIIATLDRSAAPEGDFSANIRVNAGAAGQPVIGVTARIAPRPPTVESVTLVPDTWSEACTSEVRVAFSDESSVTGRLFWEITPNASSGSRPLARSGELLVADLPPGQTFGQIEFWVVVTDALGASVESQHRTVAALSGSC
jgi:hypothetical protein